MGARPISDPGEAGGFACCFGRGDDDGDGIEEGADAGAAGGSICGIAIGGIAIGGIAIGGGAAMAGAECFIARFRLGVPKPAPNPPDMTSAFMCDIPGIFIADFRTPPIDAAIDFATDSVDLIFGFSPPRLAIDDRTTARESAVFAFRDSGIVASNCCTAAM